MADDDLTWNEGAAIFRGNNGSMVVKTAHGLHQLDGEATDELARAIEPGALVPEAWLDEVEGSGLLAGRGPPLARYLGTAPLAVRVRVEGAPAAVAIAARILQRAGATLDDDAPDLVLAFAFKGSVMPIRRALERWAALAEVLPVELDGATVRVGPVGGDGRACWTCAETRVANNTAAPDGYALTRGEPLHAPNVPEELATMAAMMGAFAARAHLRSPGSLTDHQLSFDLATLGTDVAPILPVPGCETCTQLRAGRSTMPRSRAAPRRAL